MTKDRIKDLEKNTSWPSVLYSSLSQELPSNEVPDTNNHSTTINIDNQSNIANFLQEIDIIRSVIDKIDNLTQDVKKIYTKLLEPMANPKLKHELDDKTEEIKNLSYETSAKLKKIEQTPDDPSETNAQRRIRESQVFVLTRRFRDTMIQYNKESLLHREKCKTLIACELELAGNRKSSDALEEILESGSCNFSVLVDFEKAKQSLNQIEARHRDILKLENSLKELHNMFLDLAVLVANQGEMIDSIEHNVAKAGGYVEDAKQNVNTALIKRKQAIRKRIILTVAIIVAVIVILLIVLLGFFTQKKLLGR